MKARLLSERVHLGEADAPVAARAGARTPGTSASSAQSRASTSPHAYPSRASASTAFGPTPRRRRCRGKVHAEERQPRVGHRVDQVAARGGARSGRARSTRRGTARSARRGRSPSAARPGRDCSPAQLTSTRARTSPPVGARRRSPSAARRRRSTRVTEADLAAGARDLRRRARRDTARSRRCPSRDVQRGDAGDVRLQLAQPLGVRSARSARRWPAARSSSSSSARQLARRRPRRSPCRRCSNGTPCSRQNSSIASRPRDASRRLQRAGPVVDAGVEDAGVVAGLVRARRASPSRAPRRVTPGRAARSRVRSPARRCRRPRSTRRADRTRVLSLHPVNRAAILGSPRCSGVWAGTTRHGSGVAIPCAPSSPGDEGSSVVTSLRTSWSAVTTSSSSIAVDPTRSTSPTPTRCGAGSPPSPPRSCSTSRPGATWARRGTTRKPCNGSTSAEPPTC